MSFKTRFSFAAALTFFLVACAGGARALAVGVSITIAPPALPVYVQPPVPAPGYLWTPGYWAFWSRTMTITGCRVPGWRPRKWAFSGLRGIGQLPEAGSCGTRVTGDRKSDFMAA